MTDDELASADTSPAERTGFGPPPHSIMIFAFGVFLVVVSVFATVIAITAGGLANWMGVELLPPDGDHRPWALPIFAAALGLWFTVSGLLWFFGRWLFGYEDMGGDDD